MNDEMYKDMALQLLDISFDTVEWNKNVLDEIIDDVVSQIKELKVPYNPLLNKCYLYDLLIEAYKTNHFETY